MPVLMPNALVKRAGTKEKTSTIFSSIAEEVSAKWLSVASISFDCMSACVCVCICVLGPYLVPQQFEFEEQQQQQSRQQ